jgi:hypothetical protein
MLLRLMLLLPFKQLCIGNIVTPKSIFWTFHLMLCLALLGGYLGSRTWAQNDQGKERPTPALRDVRCALSTEKHRWQIAQPAVISIHIKNITDSSLDLSVVPILNIEPKPGVQHTNVYGYWSPVDIVANRALDTIQEKLDGNVGVSIKPKPLSLHLESNGQARFKIDANQTKWDRQVSSKWPALPFSEIVLPGNYLVSLDLGSKGNDIHCNKVEVQIKAAR